jgi:hypothetical protein
MKFNLSKGENGLADMRSEDGQQISSHGVLGFDSEDWACEWSRGKERQARTMTFSRR